MRRSLRTHASKALSLLALPLVACGPPGEAKSADGENLNWAAGAPEVRPAYTEEEIVRLSICPLITTVVLSAGRAKGAGAPAETHLNEIKSRDWDSQAIEDLVLSFTKMTYDSEYEDLFVFSQQTQESCVKEIGEVNGSRAKRANFCLNRHMTEAAGSIFKKEVPESQLAEKLKYFPGYGAPYLATGFREKSPDHGHWLACVGAE